MAMTHDYLDFLNQRVDIAPANSQEELQAAETIASLMSQHSVEPSIEEFDAPVVSGLGRAILAIVMFLGLIVSGFGIIALSLVGFVLAAIPAALAILRLFGREPSLSLGPQARSQNVVAVHRATGPLVTKGSRRIVIVAHYDTPRESFLYTSPVAPYVPLIVRVSAPCSYAVAVCALLQVMGFIPAPARIVFWILGIVASVPALVLAAGAIHERMSSCTLGANDNKSGVAALLGVMENVRPSGLVPTPREPEQSRDLDEVEGAAEVTAAEEEIPEQEAAAPEEEPLSHEAPAESIPAPVEVVGVRHGEKVLRELQILPETCEIDYYVPEPVPTPVRAVPPIPRSTSLPIMEAPAPASDETPFVPETEEAAEEVGGTNPLEGALESLKRFAHDAVERVQTLVSSRFAGAGEQDEHQGVARGGAAAAAEHAAEQARELDLEPAPIVPPAPVTASEAVPAAAEEPVPDPETTAQIEAEVDKILSEPVPEEADVQAVPEAGSEAAAPVDEPEPSATAPMPTVAAENEQEPDAEGTLPMEPVSADVSREDLMSTGHFSIVMDEGTRGVGPKDSSGLTAMDESSLDIDQPTPARRRPEAPEDPEWGKATFRPSVSNVARRASLFDLPDPLENEADPFGDPSATRVATRRRPTPVDQHLAAATEEPKAAPAVSSPQPIETLSSEHAKAPSGGLMGKLKGMFSGKGSSDEGWLGSDDSSDGDDKVWRGGAATRSGLRLVGEDEGAPSDEELRDAALALGDDALVAHDIWFVALGGSSLDHAGMRSFLAEHRSEIRGSFVINLNCVGAGDLTLLTHEGVSVKRRADRRLGRILSNVARDVHVELGQRDFSWTSTDAWVAMRSSLRALTIMGVDENGLPALSHTPMDVPENVSGDQTALVAELVTEAIRRS